MPDNRGMKKITPCTGCTQCCKGYAKRLCPVDTGRLRNSITHTIDADDNTAVIGTNVEYAISAHEGTSKREGNPFLLNAVNQNADKYRKIAEAEVKGD